MEIKLSSQLVSKIKGLNQQREELSFRLNLVNDLLNTTITTVLDMNGIELKQNDKAKLSEDLSNIIIEHEVDDSIEILEDE